MEPNDIPAAPQLRSLTAFVPEDVLGRMNELARVADRSLSAEVRLALKAWVEAADKDQGP